MTISPASIDLGQVLNEAGATVEFDLSNPGPQPVKLISGQTSCGCYYLQLPESVPAKSQVHVRALLRVDESWYGRHDDTISIQTDATVSPTLTLKLQGDYRPFIGIEPETPHKVSFEPGQPLQLHLKAHPRSGITMASIQADDPSFSIRQASAKDGIDVVVASKGPMPTGDFSLKLTATAEPVRRLAFYTIQGEATNGPVSFPNRIELPYLKAGTKGQALATLNVRSRVATIQILSVKSSDPAVGVRFDPVGIVDVSYKGGWTSGVKRGTISIRTTDKVASELKVPFRITVTD